MKEISIVVPVYKEEKNIRPFLSRIEAVLSRLNLEYEIIFALDPSPDHTEAILVEEIHRNPNIKVLVFSRRFGQPAATMAGILASAGNTCVVIDVDLQDPPELIETMYKKLMEGYEVVYAKRCTRKGETLIKRFVSYIGYAIINRISDVRIPRNTGDFRIMTRRVMEELRRLNEIHGFLRGLVAYVGFQQAYVEYDRDARHEGKGNYNRLMGSIKIGLNGVISFSSRPLQLMSLVGFLLSVVSFTAGSYVVISKLLWSNYIEGFTTLALLITFLSGVHLLSLGLMGEYVSRIYDEVKKRPNVIVDKKINF